MPEVFLENLTKYYGKIRAVENLSFKVKNKETVAILGPSGCGKTTTLRMIAGLEKPTSGKIYIDGKDVTDLPPKERNIGMVFENQALYPHMTVYEHLAFPIREKLSKIEIDKKVKEIAELLGIAHRLNHRPGQLSGGERQRTALGRAIIKDPAILLMDEPLRSIDALLRINLRRELKKLQRKLGLTVICATMDYSEAMSMGDKIAIMSDGRILQTGSGLEIYDMPRTIDVARIFGAPPMNLLQGKLIKEEGMDKYVITINDEEYLTIDCKGADKEILHKIINESVMIGFKPSEVILYNHPVKESLECNLSLCERMGNYNIGHFVHHGSVIRVALPGQANKLKKSMDQN